MEKKQQQKIIIIVLLGVFLILMLRSRLAENKEKSKAASAKAAAGQSSGEIQVSLPGNVIIEFNPKSAKDPFKSPVRKKPKNVETREVKVDLPPMSIKGIIWDVDMPQAVINDKVFKVGDDINGAEIVSIEKGAVYLKYRGNDFTLVLADIGKTEIRQ